MNEKKKQLDMRSPKEVLTITDHLLYVDWQNPFRKSHQYSSTNIHLLWKNVEELDYFKSKSHQLISSYTAIYPTKTFFAKSVQITKKKKEN